ncbi:MAG TPA: DUF4412 domain-containing protein [Vicinamibacteria bacterium]|nr:DUF4412 domain-containing protein [Vicinamibacteria bacterium]
MTLVLPLAALFLAAPSSGIYFEQTTLVQPEPRAGAPGVRSRVWCAGRRLRLEAADVADGPALVLRLDEGRALRLDPESRTAVELDVSRLRARSAADAAVAAGLMGAAEPGELRTRRLEGQRTIAGHACAGFRLSGGSVSVETWVAEDVPARAETFAEFMEWSGASQALFGLVSAIRALPGFPLETRLRVDVLGETKETVSTVTAIRALAIPKERFEVPAGWRLVGDQARPAEVAP